MTIVPNFILKRIYQAGSLRREGDGVAFELKNIIGPGQITQLVSIELGSIRFTGDAIQLITEGQTIFASTISDKSPMAVSMNQLVTCVLTGQDLADGSHPITLVVVTKEGGTTTVTFQDSL